jgi:CheY-like chemotaxis protein
MGGKIYLDDNYDSGIPGCPGTRFVVNLKVKPVEQQQQQHQFPNIFPFPPSKQHSDSIKLQQLHSDLVNNNTTTTTATASFHLRTSLTNNNNNDNNNSNATSHNSCNYLPSETPEKLSILFVDDDSILRKLFTRSMRVVFPQWTVREAASGESALHILESETNDTFDLIFIDMYMASTEKQLLGTETIVALRQKGIQCIICGVSANDKESEFIQAGADAFLYKPFPTERNALIAEITRILNARQ